MCDGDGNESIRSIKRWKEGKEEREREGGERTKSVLITRIGHLAAMLVGIGRDQGGCRLDILGEADFVALKTHGCCCWLLQVGGKVGR